MWGQFVYKKNTKNKTYRQNITYFCPPVAFMKYMHSVVTLQGSAIKQVTIKMVVMCFSAASIAMTLVFLSNLLTAITSRVATLISAPSKVHVTIEYHVKQTRTIKEELIIHVWFLACRSRQASIVLERYFRFEVSLLSILCMRMEMGTIRVSGGSDIIT